MAYFDEDEFFPVWLPGSLPEDLGSGSALALLGIDAEAGDAGFDPHRESLHGYIVHDWFGPFLLSPPSKFLRGRC